MISYNHCSLFELDELEVLKQISSYSKPQKIEVFTYNKKGNDAVQERNIREMVLVISNLLFNISNK